MDTLCHLLSPITQAAVAGGVLGYASQLVQLSVTPDLARGLIAGTYKWMEEASGAGYRANVVDAITNVSVGQAIWTPASVATVGAVAAWQVLSVVVAQKHLLDIRQRLDEIARQVESLRRILDEQLISGIRGDAAHLVAIARSVEEHGARESAWIQTTDDVVRAARGRHDQIRARVRTLFDQLRPDSYAFIWFGRGMVKHAAAAQRDLAEIGRGMVMLRLSALLFAAATELLRRLRHSPPYVTQLEADLGRLIDEDDDLLEKLSAKVEHAVLGLSSKLRRRSAVAAVRVHLASCHWRQTKSCSVVRAGVDDTRGLIERRPARLALQLDSAGSVVGIYRHVPRSG